MKNEIQLIANEIYKKPVKNCSEKEIFYILLFYTKQQLENCQVIDGDKKLYYFSSEFLIGKLLSNNLINLDIYDEVDKLLEEWGFNLANIEEIENEPSLGNGGLGRLAACFLDSIATLNLPGDGIGLNYHFGFFKQEIRNNKQYETTDQWIEEYSWLSEVKDSFLVKMGKNNKLTLKANLREISVPGFKNDKINKLKLFDLETVDETIVKENNKFDKTSFDKNLTLFLYPDDSKKEGELLRIAQQYFMVSAGAQLIIKEYKEKHNLPLKEIANHVVIQINDTHPSMIIPEFMRIFQEQGIKFEDAYDIVSKMIAYTNHTILAEALEKWPIDYLKIVCPKILIEIKKINKYVGANISDYNSKIAIIDSKLVHMARMDIHTCFSVNGVAALHTNILENSELKDFYKLYPEKFNNKTNGITFRRWLIKTNPELTKLIESKIGTSFHEDAMLLSQVKNFIKQPEFVEEYGKIKQLKKEQLKKFIKDEMDIEIDSNSIYDIQIKRLHEYKRQQMNALGIINSYLEIKKGNLPVSKVTYIFSSKAAPAYTMAKNIIHLIMCLEQLINNDEIASQYMKIVFIPNYCVDVAEKLIPACDISEQISLASKEASGTGNMKLMLNGALTLGTLDGANIEIQEEVGQENIYIFGKDANTVLNHYENKTYIAKNFYKKSRLIKEAVDFINGKELSNIGDEKLLLELKNNLINKDYFMTFLDIEEYISTKNQMLLDYIDKQAWNKKALINIASAGFFSSDRTIKEYNDEIWGLKINE